MLTANAASYKNIPIWRHIYIYIRSNLHANMCSSFVLSFHRIVQAIRLHRFFVHTVFIQPPDEINVSPACSRMTLISAHDMLLLVSVRYNLLLDPSWLFWCACFRIAPNGVKYLLLFGERNYRKVSTKGSYVTKGKILQRGLKNKEK